MNKRIFSLFALFLIAALVVVGCAGPSTGGTTGGTTGGGAAGAPAECSTEGACWVIASGAPVKIAYAGPLTGDNANYGIDISNAIKLAVAKADINGHKVELDPEDDQGTPEGGAQVANRVVSANDTVAVVGGTFSGATNAAIPIYQQARIPMVSPSATNPSLTTLGSDVFNRVAYNDNDQGRVAAEFIYNTLGAKKLAIIHDGTTYGQALAEVARDAYTGLGGEVSAFEAITPGDKDYSAVLTQISSNKPDALFFGGYAPEAGVIVSQMATSGLDGVTFISDDGTYGDTYVQLGGAAAEGSYVTSAGVPAASDAKAAFDEEYKAAYGQETGVLSGFSWFGYDAANVIFEAIKSVAVDVDSTLYIPKEALIKAVRGTKDFQGLTGNITCSDVGECNATGPAVFQVKDGKFVTLD